MYIQKYYVTLQNHTAFPLISVNSIYRPLERDPVTQEVYGLPFIQIRNFTFANKSPDAWNFTSS